MVFQSYALYPNMNVAQNIAFGLEMRKVPKAQRDEAVQRVAAMLQIGALLARKPAELSGGQRQRVAMGRALARDPKLFLFDEPLSNLDAKLRVEMRAEIKLLHQRTRTTTVYVTHDQVEAMTLGDRVAVMQGGVVQQFGTPDDIYARPANRFVAEFVGSPTMNFIELDAGTAPGSAGFALPLAEVQRQLLLLQQQGASYGVRPEDLQLGTESGAEGLAGTLLMLEPTGPETYATVQTPLGVLTARVSGRVAQRVGDAVALQWRPEAVHLFDRKDGRRLC
jgi:multiple sugar transport system ATP-binding protein